MTYEEKEAVAKKLWEDMMASPPAFDKPDAYDKWLVDCRAKVAEIWKQDAPAPKIIAAVGTSTVVGNTKA